MRARFVFEAFYTMGKNNYGGIYFLHKNPISLKKFSVGCRGILTENGDLYVDIYGKAIHPEIIKKLIKTGVLKYKEYYTGSGYEHLVGLQRYGNTNKMMMAESYDSFILKDNEEMKYIKELYKIYKEKHSDSLIEMIPDIIN